MYYKATYIGAKTFSRTFTQLLHFTPPFYDLFIDVVAALATILTHVCPLRIQHEASNGVKQ